MDRQSTESPSILYPSQLYNPVILDKPNDLFNARREVKTVETESMRTRMVNSQSNENEQGNNEAMDRESEISVPNESGSSNIQGGKQ